MRQDEDRDLMSVGIVYSYREPTNRIQTHFQRLNTNSNSGHRIRQDEERCRISHSTHTHTHTHTHTAGDVLSVTYKRIVCRIAFRASRTCPVANSNSGKWYSLQFMFLCFGLFDN